MIFQQGSCCIVVSQSLFARACFTVLGSEWLRKSEGCSLGLWIPDLDLVCIGWVIDAEEVYGQCTETVVQRILRYLIGTLFHGLLLQPAFVKIPFEHSMMPDWASDVDDRRSTSGTAGLLFFLAQT